MPETYYNEAEIQAMLNEFGVDVTIAGVTAKGIVDRVDEELMVGLETHGIGKSIMVTVTSAAFPGLTNEAMAIVDGVSYKVTNIMQIGDGALKRFICAVEVS